MRGTLLDSPIDWLSFRGPSGQAYQVNVSFLKSNYHCTFGQGCPGLLNRYSDSHDLSCCERGVTFTNEEDFEHVKAVVSELTDEDTDNLAHIRDKGWYQEINGVPYKTRKLFDGCIFANREGGPAGKPGCAFHHLALRTGRDPIDMKPEVCWTLPLSLGQEVKYEDASTETVLILSVHTADAWGGTNDGDLEDEAHGYMGYWCIDTPDAYNNNRPVYQSFEGELRKLMGDMDYEMMVQLVQVRTATPMPGEVRNEGRPMIPLLVEKAKANGLPIRPPRS